MKWTLAGVCFALLVALAIATASIRAGNVKRQALLQATLERYFDYKIAYEYELVLWHQAAHPRRLVSYWLALEEARYQ